MQENFFSFYGLPIRLDIDFKLLRKKYLSLSKQLHPDFFTQATPAERDEALKRASYNNKAYNTLKDEDQRVEYVLKLLGLIDSQSKDAMDPDFLMEMMSLNMEVEDSKKEDQDSLKDKIDEMILNERNAIQQIWNTWQDTTNENSDLILVKDYYFKKKYFLRIKEKISTFEP